MNPVYAVHIVMINLILKVVTKSLMYEEGGRKERQIFGTVRPFEPKFSSECDFRFKFRVEISVITAKWINVIDRLFKLPGDFKILMFSCAQTY